MGVYGQETGQVQHKGPSGPSIPLGGGSVARQITRNGYCGSCLSLSGNKFMERVNTVIIIHSLQYCLDTQLGGYSGQTSDLVYNLPDWGLL